jgi:D-proline reductase (dithiol) PrdB
MCNQAVCLLAAEIERRGIATVCIVLLREVAEQVRPPRALSLPFPHGYPLGAPNDAAQQREVMLRALALLQREGPPPLLEE